MLRLGLVRSAALLLALAACASAGAARPDPIAVKTPKPDAIEGLWRASLSMDVTGAETVTLRTETRLRVVEILGTSTPVAAWFLSLSASDFALAVEDGRTILFSADLAPGLYRGPDQTYELSSETQGEVLGVPANLGSGAYVQLTDLEARTQARYDTIAVPCTLTVGPAVASGSVDCPRLEDEEGRAVTLRWSWKLLPPA